MGVALIQETRIYFLHTLRNMLFCQHLVGSEPGVLRVVHDVKQLQHVTVVLKWRKSQYLSVYVSTDGVGNSENLLAPKSTKAHQHLTWLFATSLILIVPYELYILFVSIYIYIYLYHSVSISLYVTIVIIIFYCIYIPIYIPIYN